MIDTIALTLLQHEFQIIDHSKFSPSSLGFFEPPFLKVGSRGIVTCIQNATKEDKEQKRYMPNLTLIKRRYVGGYVISLKVEFSASKLLLGNNFDELSIADFKVVLKILKNKLLDMGVLVSKTVLEKAKVSKVHYSKNIPLTDYSTPYSVLIELYKLNMSRVLDCNRTDFRNEGHSLKFHSNTQEVVFYDKIKDLRQARVSEKRAMENENYLQLDFLEGKALQKPFEMIRFEVRLNDRKQIKKVFMRIGFESEGIVFKDVFSADVSREVLKYYMNIINKAYMKISLVKFKSPQDFYYDILENNENLSAPKALQILGLKVLTDQVGIRESRKMLSQSSTRTVSRLFEEANKLSFTQIKSNPFKQIIECLNEFKPIKINNYIKID